MSDATQTKRAELIAAIEAKRFRLSFSKLSAFMVSPDYFIRYALKETKRTKAMRFGSMLHCLVLEPDKFGEFYAVMPDGVKLNTNEGREAYFDFLRGIAGDLAPFEADLGRAATFRDYKALAEFLELTRGIEFVDNTARHQSHEMAYAILSDPRAAEIINNATDTELAVDFELDGWQWRGKIDIVNGSHIADLKSVRNADPRRRNLKWELKDDGYFLQQYIYRRAIGQPGENRVICVDGDCQVSVVRLGNETMMQAEADFNRVMAAFERCRFKEEWSRSFGFWEDSGEFEF